MKQYILKSIIMIYYFTTTLNCTFEEALSKIDRALARESFGIVSEINMQEKFKEKLNVDFPKYTILGTCNPAFAHKAIQKENKIGTMLPCNFIVQETNEGKIEVTAVDPAASMMAIQNPELENLATEVRHKIKNIIDSLQND
ncbi:MAG: DUF302 domain-containing protein [Bacteroidales bacterium]|nr:DUF302 domain-containing protein [Bacteroidales bacterium]